MESDFQNIIANFSLIVVDKVDNEKIILKLDTKTEHYTLHLGMKSKVLDIHKAIEGKDNVKTYETLFKLEHFAIGRILVELKGLIPAIEMFFLSNRVNPGFLRRYDFIIQPLDEKSITQNPVMNFNEKKGKLKFNKEKIATATLDQFLITDIDLNIKEGPYLVWKANGHDLVNNGLLLVFIRQGKSEFYFISKKRMNQFNRLVFEKIITGIRSSTSANALKFLNDLESVYKSTFPHDNKFLSHSPKK